MIKHGYECTESDCTKDTIKKQISLLCISPETTLRELLSIPLLSDIRNDITFGKASDVISNMGDNRISDLVGPIGRIINDITNGYNGLIEKKLSGEVRSCQHGLLFFKGYSNGPFAIVCPGGGYIAPCAFIEGIPIAYELSKMGINTFVLRYTTGVVESAKRAREDLGTAIKYIMDNKYIFDVSANYAVFGFSAGGHLAAELGTNNLGFIYDGIPKPEALILGYPLVNLDHCEKELKKEMLDIMLHPDWTREELEQYQILNHIDENYPDTYIWHSLNDDMVMYEENSLSMYRLLNKKGIRCKMKTVARAEHGIGLGSGTDAEGWLEEAVAFWLKKNKADTCSGQTFLKV